MKLETRRKSTPDRLTKVYRQLAATPLQESYSSTVYGIKAEDMVRQLLERVCGEVPLCDGCESCLRTGDYAVLLDELFQEARRGRRTKEDLNLLKHAMGVFYTWAATGR